ncbi:MAG: 2-hydroxychromene-2-carboxylate isomerase [Erythrobacter sp.]|uniref:2-hydroxychromene-2-carboxylate isomerase n=1 Tax=Erythrobacter sp. TaxID=1042 RepID=UPI002604C283|nr:2-hydroxychromene-2-carboxylate isomerase [Erythrobacter sp.]MDJ0978114.1 2-hydroxychromene-2-carboxylate isomerase [Erythrobacter sp.]
MTKRVELIFDFVSPNAYLIWWPLRELVQRTGAELDVTPVFLGGMHKLTGNAPPMIRNKDVKGKVEYDALEMRRFIAKHGLTKFKLHPKFPFNSISLQRLLVAAEQDGRSVQFAEAMLPKVWEEGVDITDPETLAATVAEIGFDAADMMARIQTDDVKQVVARNTDHAVERGAFGIPTMFVGEKDGPQEMFFGKERLAQIEEELVSG